MCATKRLMAKMGWCLAILVATQSAMSQTTLLHSPAQGPAVLKASALDVGIFESEWPVIRLKFLAPNAARPESVQIDFDKEGGVDGCTVAYPAKVKYEDLVEAMRSMFGKYEKTYGNSERTDGLEYWIVEHPHVLITITQADADGMCRVLYLSKPREAKADRARAMDASPGSDAGSEFQPKSTGADDVTEAID